jgi:hypothetical protein
MYRITIKSRTYEINLKRKNWLIKKNLPLEIYTSEYPEFYHVKAFITLIEAYDHFRK